ncbi:hypothetical protein [Aurantimicrobium minutum]|uniref:hypothetical protein n=1 Tax=Aurantimicrobium minutum TaxID=708131 RepID=UPI002474FAC0|nr:hypothetical protein [Aurantimicrobium minutum]MDH6422544.1 dihydrofolate reductase [Aurantimicrobium minutum]
MESSQLTDLQLSELYLWPTTRTFRLNMVLDQSGHSQGVDGTSNTLTSSEDRRILRVIRQPADVVISGAKSIRAEGWFLPPLGRLAVLSRSGNLPWESCPDRSRVHVYPSISALIHSLKEHETHILCEGGLEVAQQLAQQIGFDEIALTRMGRTSDLPLPEALGIGEEVKLCEVLTDTKHNMTFQFWRRAEAQQ